MNDRNRILVRFYEKPMLPGFARGGLARAAQKVRAAGRHGDDVLIHVNQDELRQMKQAWGPYQINPNTGIPEYGFLSKAWKKLKNVAKFEVSNLKSMLKGAKKNPLSLLLGAATPVGAKLWGGITGKKFDPLVNIYGGPTEQSYLDAEAKGIDTGLSRGSHKVAELVASYYGGKGALSGLGKLAGAGVQSLKGGALGRAVDKIPGLGSGIEPAVVPGIPELGVSEAVVQAPTLGGTLADKAGGVLAKVGPYLKDPKNWGTIAKGVGALGLLSSAGGSGGGSSSSGPPPLPDWYNEPLPEIEWNRRQTMTPPDNYYTYGEMPEQLWFDDNTLPQEPPEDMYRGGFTLKHGGSPYVDLGSAESGRADNIDAKLSENEYVIDAETVALLGDGNPEAGAKKLDDMRMRVRKHKGGALSRGKFSPTARDPMTYLGAR